MTIAADDSERHTNRSRRRIRLQFSLAALFAFVFVIAIVSAVGRYAYDEFMVARRPIPWQGYTPELMERLERERRPVLMYFSADWNMTMAVLKFTVLETPEVRRAIHYQNMNAVYVDCTSAPLWRDYNLNQIPAVIVFPGCADLEPAVIFGAFTKETIIEAIRAAAQDKSEI